MAEDYKISLGIDLNTNDLMSDINKLDDKYKIKLGVDLKVNDIRDRITQYNANNNNAKLKLGIKLDTDDLKRQINQLNLNVNGNKGVTVPVNTTSLEHSLNEVKEIIANIKTSLGTLDSKTGMKSLLSAVNQIATALGKAENESQNLINSLNALSKKDFSFNFNLKAGNSNPVKAMTDYGREARRNTIPQLQEQSAYLENLLGGYQKADRALEVYLTKIHKARGISIKNNLIDDMANTDSISKQMEAIEKYIGYLKKIATTKGISLDDFNSQFSKSANDIVEDTVKIQTGAKQTEEALDEISSKFKNIFSSGIDAEKLSSSLDSIVVDLGEIKTSLNSLSSGTPLNGLISSFEKLSTSIDELIKKCGNVRTAINNGVGGANVVGSGNTVADDVNKTAEELKTAYNKLKNISKNIGSIKIKLSDGLDSSDDVKQIQVLEKQLQSFTAEYHKTVSKIKDKGDLSSTQWQSIQQQIDNTKVKLDQLEAEVADAKSKLAKKISLKLETGDFTNQVKKIESDSNKLSGTYREVQTGISEVNKALDSMKTAANKNDIDGLISANEEYERALKDVQNQLQINARAEKDAASAAKLDDSRSAFQSNIDAWLTKNSAAAKKFGAQMLELKAQAKSCDQVTLNHLKNEFKRLDKEAEAAGLKMQTFGDKLRTQFSKYSSYFSVASLFIYASQGLRDMFNQVVAIDSAMTELKKVTDETDASYNQFLSNAASRSKELGTTLEGLVSSTADFARLGYSFEESQGLAEVANIYAVVGDEIEGVEGATQSLISTLAAFKDEASGISDSDFAMDIVDKFNEVSNNFAISSGGIGEAMQRSASSLRAANNTIDESIAMITAANEVTQNPEKVGNAMKTISMRIRGAKTELEEAGESTDGMVESTAKLRQEIMALSGVDIMLDKDNFKSTYQIMDELAEKWEDLSDISQATIIELMAGKHQGNVFASLMQNFDMARDALETSLNSSGSAMAEHAKWSESLEARLLKLKATWQSLSQSFMSSNFLKVALDGVIGLVNGVNKLIDTFGTLPTLLTGFAMFRSAFSNKGIFKTFNNDLDGFTNKIGIANKSFAELLNAFRSANTGGFKGVFNGLKSVGDAIVNPLSKTDLSAIDAYNKLIDAGVDSQKAFAKTMGNTSIAAQDLVKSANGSKVAINGVKTASIGGKVALLGMRAAALLMNAALTMGISLLIDFAVSGITKLINADKDLAESVDEITSKFKEQHDELQKLKGDYDTTNESSMVNKYAKLSKGVDNFGRNVSLTAEEYSEYQSIVDTIADQFPSLISGYDEQGNALLSCKGNVEQLNEAYEKLIHLQNQEILSTNAADIEKNWRNALKQVKGYDFWEKIGNWFSFDGFLGGTTDDYDMKTNTAEWLKGLTSNPSNVSQKDIKKYLDENQYSTMEIIQSLQNAGYDVNQYSKSSTIAKVLKEALEKEPEKIQNILDTYYAQFDEVIAEYKTKATALLSEAFDVSSAISGLEYGNISEELQNIAYQTVNSLDFDFLSNLTESGKTIDQWTKELLNQLNAISKEDNAQIETAFDLQTRFNGGEIAYGEYVRNLKDVQSTIDDLNLKGEAKEQLEISLGLDENGIIDQYNALVKRLTDPKNYDFDISENEAKKLLDGLSSEELAVAVDIIADMSNNDYSETADEIRTAIERELSIKGLSLDLTVEKAKVNFEALSTAISESFSGSGLSEESIGAVEGIFGGLKGYDPSKLFERTANGIRLNSEEYRRLNSEYKKINTANVNKEMSTLGDIYNQTREELYRLTYGTDEYNDKARDLSAIEQQIKDLEKLAAGYEGLTSAFQEWQMVESAGSQRDMYESIIEGFENIDDEISRGWYDDGTIEFLELLSGKDLSTAGIEEVKKAYKGLGKEIEHTSYSVRDFFTVDDDGNSTNAGVYNFLDAIGQLEEEAFGGKDVVQRKDGKIIGFNFDLVGGDEVIAEALGVSEELVQIMVRAADDAGFVVTLDGSFEQLDILKEKAQEAAESLNRTLEKSGKKGFDFNFNTSNVDDITKQLGEAQKILDTFRNTDGTINTKIEGADEALTVAGTLQSMLDKLTRPTYMDIEVNQVEDELQEPLKHLQELRRLTETEHQLKLSGGDTTQLTSDIEELYTELEELPDETKVEIGLVDDKKQPLTGDALKKKINDIVSGDAELGITATVDIQLEMDEKLGILVDKALLEAGIISDEEFKKRVDIYLEADVDNEDAKNKTKEAVNEVTSSGGESSTHESSSGRTHGGTSGTFEVPVNAEVKVDKVKTEGFWGKIKSWWNGLWSKDKTETAEVETDVDVEAGEIDTSGVNKSINEAVEKVAELEVTAEELTGLVQDLESKDIIIDVKVKGLDDVKELNKNIDLATEIDGSVDKLSEFVEGAKALSELDDNISTFVTAEVKGNVVDEFEYKLNNLKVFSDSAKDLDEIGIVKSEVTADVKGNVIDEFEYKINNLKVFSDSAKDLGDIGNVESNVKATINSGENGDVIDEFEYKLDNLGEFAEYVKKLQGLGDVDISVKATINSGDNGDVIDEFEYKLDNLGEFAKHVEELQGLQSVDISVNASVNTGENGDVVDTFEYKLNNLSKFADYVKELQGLDNVDVSVNATVNTGNDGDAIDTFEYKLNNLEVFAQGAKALQGVGNVSSEVTAKVNTGESGDAIDTFEYKLNNLETFAEGAKALQGIGNVDVSVSAKVNTGESGDVIDTFEYKLDNLDEFAEYAKELQGLENVDISIKANVNTGESGDVVDTFEYKLNNLDEFADYAKDLQGLESVDITISANAKGDVVGEKTEAKINNLEVFAKGAKELQGLEDVDISVNATVSGDVTETAEYKLDNLGVFKKHAKELQGLEDVDVSVNAEISGNVPEKTEGYIDDLQVFAKGAKALQGLKDVDISVNADIGGNVPDKTEGYLDDLQVFAKGAKALQGLEDVDISVNADVSGNALTGDGVTGRLERLTEFKSLVNNMSDKTVSIKVTASVDADKINGAIDILKKVSDSGVFKNYSATVKVGAIIDKVDDTKVKNYKAPAKKSKVSYSVDEESSVYTWTAPPKDGVVNYSAKVDALTDSQKHKTGTITYKAKISGFPVVNGTANAYGSAFANGTNGKAYKHGDWGTKKTETALTGELGQELVVYKNRYWTVGDNGAEFATIPKGAIVFNHKQTAELFANGKVTSGGGRGKVFANGTAFAEGTAYSTGSGGAGKSEVTSYSAGENPSSSDSDSNSDSENKFEETIDWIEIILDRAERAIDKYEKQANNIYKTWAKRNKALENEIAEVGSAINLYEQAKNKYLSEANAVGLNESYASKIRNGSFSIEDFEGESDEKLVEKIKNYQDLYEKYLNCIDKIEELKEQESSLYSQRFEHVQSEYDNLLQAFDHTEAMLNEYISQSEEKGYIVSRNYYDALIDNEESRINKLKEEQADLIAERDKAVADGKIDKYSEAWYDQCAAIDETTQAIESGITALIEYSNKIKEIDWEVFDIIQQRITDITDEANFFIELMGNKDLYDDNGKFTEQGVATVGLHAQNYNTNMYQADLAGEEAAKLKQQLANDPNNKILEEQYRERIAQQREYILAAEDAKNAIVDLVEEGINLELEALDEQIQKYQDALDAQKDLYDYQKRVEEQTKEISSLQKQLSAYEGDDSEEAKAKIQELRVSLEEAEADLEETEYDKFISDQSALLDNLFIEAESLLNQRLDNVDFLLEQIIAEINSAAGAEGTIATALGSEGAIATILGGNATTIKTTLETEAKNVGVTLSDAMNNIWSVGDGNAKSVLTMYGEDFKSKSTTINTTLNGIKVGVDSMVASLNKEAEKKVAANKTSSSSKKNPTTSSAPKTPTTPANTNKSSYGGDGKATIGDKVKFLSGKYYYDSQGKTPAGSKYQGKEVYITNVNTRSWATHPYHISTGKKLGSGDLGWLKLNQISGYAVGKKNSLKDELAWTQENGQEYIVRPSDGAILTPVAKGDSVLTSAATNNIWSMANSPAEFIRDNLNFGSANVPNNSTVQNSYTQNLEKVVFSFPNVKNYDEMLAAMQRDPNFERLVEAMSLNKISGKSSLTKGKAIR